VLNEKNSQQKKNDDLAVLKQINAIRNGLTPADKPTGQGDKTAAAQPEEQIKLDNLAPLVKQAVIKTNFGDITVEFYAQDSPLAVNNFLNLAQRGFYNGTKFHRVIGNFMIQGGDPLSRDDDWSDDGRGGPGYKFQDEINSYPLVRGSLAMANSGPDTNGSQFFIITRDSTPWLDGKHTNFGRVVGGMDTVDKIEAVKTDQNDHPTEDIVIESIELVQ
jgi:cyclophilin family peptidyl-prolyl cis-trans isomerase